MDCLKPIHTYKGDFRCGKCLACLAFRSEQENIRYMYESRNYFGYFVTLTYCDECLPYWGVNKEDVRLFLNKCKSFSTYFKYVVISEYGGRFSRPHYHALLWFDSDFTLKDLEKCWKFGNVSISLIDDKQTKYVAKYHTTKVLSQDVFRSRFYPNFVRCLEEHNTYVLLDNNEKVDISQFNASYYPQCQPFILRSRGIGVGLLDSPEFDKYVDQGYYINDNACKTSIPRYLRDKLGSDKRNHLLSKQLERSNNLAKNPFIDLNFRNDPVEFQRNIDYKLTKWKEKYEKNVIEKKLHRNCDL